MGCGNPPAMTAHEEELQELSLSTRPSGPDDSSRSHSFKTYGASAIASPSISWGYNHFPPQCTHGDWQPNQTKCEIDSSYLGDCLNFSFSNVSKTHESLINGKRDLSEFHMGELHHAADGHNTVSAGCSMDTTISTMDCKSDVHMNFLSPRCEIGASYPIREHGPEAKNIKISRLHVDGKFSSTGHGPSALPLMDNFSIPRNETETDINIIHVPLSTQQVDRDFLTLGIGGGREMKSNSHFSTREISCKLEDTVPSQQNSYYVGQNPSSFVQLTGRPAGVQTNYGELSSIAGMMSTHDEGGVTVNTNSRLNSIPFHGFQTSQSYAHPNWSVKSENFDPIPSSLPFGSTPVSQHERVNSTPLGPEISSSTFISSQPISQKQAHYRRSSKNVISESWKKYPSDWYRGSSLNHAQQGISISPTEGSRARSGTGVHFQSVGNLTSPVQGIKTEVSMLGSSSVPPVGHMHISQDVRAVESHWNRDFPERIRFPIPSGSAFHQSSAGGPFPRRLGVQPNDVATIQSTSDYLQRPIRPPFAFSPPSTAAHVHTFNPSLTSGQRHHGIPTQFSRDLARVDYPMGQAIPVPKFDIRPQASPIISRPSLKRQATESHPTSFSAQRRKIFPQPGTSHPFPHKRQTIPAPVPAAVHIPSPPLHIKWPGFEESDKPIGEKCHLCNRDLSFSPEGPVNRPSNPPAAILSCGHTFHDHCLQIITPEDQSKNPPCIPCAISEP